MALTPQEPKKKTTSKKAPVTKTKKVAAPKGVATTARTAKPRSTARKITRSTISKSVAATAPKQKATTRKRATVSAKSPQSPNRRRTHKINQTASPAHSAVVELPTNVPLRLKDKVVLLYEHADEYLYRSAIASSVIGAIIFTLVSAGILYQSIVYEAGCTTDCQPALVSQASTVAVKASIPSRHVKIIDGLSGTLGATETLTFSAPNTDSVNATLLFQNERGVSQNIDLSVNPLGNDKFATTIPVSELDPAMYQVAVNIRDRIGNVDTYQLASFAVPIDDQAVRIEGESNDVVTSEQARFMVEQQALSAATNVVTITAPRNITNSVSFQYTTQNQADNIQFFARSAQSTGSQLIGSVASPPRAGSFVFNSAQLPNGSYELYARSSADGAIDESNSELVTIDNITPAESAALETGRLLTITRELNADLYQDFETGTSTTDSIKAIVADRILADQAELDQLFTQLSIAVQSNDPVLIAAAETNISQYQSVILRELLANDEQWFIADDIARELQAALETMQASVIAFEDVRRERSESDSAVDTDGDGVSDVDEVTLFNTDPTLVDTDNDGFTAGAEIIRGFNPTDASAEAAIVYESPKTTIGVPRIPELKIDSVTPLIDVSAVADEPTIKTTVRGRALPNSFVTLYLFSTPTIVTVRTNATGVFEYTFERELEDGEHQVFVALTDNTGAILAQTDPFRFVKEAEAFTVVETPVTVSEPVLLTSQDDTSSVTTVLGVSLLAIGVLLLLLGLSLKLNSPHRDESLGHV
jgi:hypothetical protein